MKPGLCKSKLSCFSRPTALPTTATCGRRLIKTFTPLPRNKLTKEIQTFQQRTPQLAPTQC
jgi:hypothetical protein